MLERMVKFTVILYTSFKVHARTFVLLLLCNVDGKIASCYGLTTDYNSKC